jgi:RNA polymerase-binding transcription factor DksA
MTAQTAIASDAAILARLEGREKLPTARLCVACQRREER